MTTAVARTTDQAHTNGLSITARTIRLIAGSTLVPDTYRNDEGSIAICLDMANRMQLPVLTVLQNLHVIKGRPSWSASFLIGAVNACGRFGPLRFRQVGEPGKPSYGFRAEAKDLLDGELLEGEAVTMAMASAEGWAQRNPKYKSMPGQMLRYRAAAFWARLYAPEIAHGLLTSEEASELPEPEGERAARLTEALTSGAERVDEATGEVQEARVEKSDPLADEFNKKHQALDDAQDYQGIAALGKQAEEAGLVWDKGEGGYRRAE